MFHFIADNTDTLKEGLEPVWKRYTSLRTPWEVGALPSDGSSCVRHLDAAPNDARMAPKEA